MKRSSSPNQHMIKLKKNKRHNGGHYIRSRNQLNSLQKTLFYISMVSLNYIIVVCMYELDIIPHVVSHFWESLGLGVF